MAFNRNYREFRRGTASRVLSRSSTRHHMAPEALEARHLLAGVVVDTPLDVVDIGNNATIGDLPGSDQVISLREALIATNNTPGADAITFDTAGAFATAQTILLQSGQLRIRDSVSITGTGAANLIIDAQSQSRVLLVNDGVAGSRLNVSLSDLSITGGYTEFNGGGIQNVAENLSITRSAISGNTSENRGGGIHHKGADLKINDSTISNNYASQGGGIWTDTNLVGTQTTTVTNTTISGNTAPIRGGGIDNFDGLTVIQNSTITNNESPLGAGVVSKGNGLTSTLVGSTIIAGNLRSDVDLSGGATNSFVSSGFNLIGIGNAAHRFNNNDQTDVFDPGLGPLADNGGPTLTHEVMEDSAAINAGANPLGLTYDQRGFPFARDDGGTDVGAFERQVSSGITVIVDTAEDEIDGDLTPGDLSLREAIDLTNSTAGADTIVFDTAGVFATPQTISLALGELTITDDVTINGPGAERVTVAGQTYSSNFRLDDGDAEHDIDVSISNLTISGAQRAGIYSRENLTVSDSVITGNAIWGVFSDPLTYTRQSRLTVSNSTVSDNRYGVYFFSGQVSVAESTITGNSASTGGGIYSVDSQLNVDATTISDNGNGIFINGGSVTVQDSTITGNTRLGGIQVGNSAQVEVVNSSITNNSVGGTFDDGTVIRNGFGGGISVGGGVSLLLDGSTVSGNAALDGGGGIFVGDDGSLTIEGSTVSHNSAYDDGGGILSSGDLNISNSFITGNSTTDRGYPDYHSGNGGGIFAEGKLTITSSYVSGNSTGHGWHGSYYDGLLPGYSGNGGGIFASGDFTVTDSFITNNSTGHGGSGYWSAGADAGHGGGIYASGAVVATRVTISGNSTGSGGAGGSRFERGRPVSGDWAGANAGHGAGIFSTGPLSIIDSSITGNRTGNGGPGYAAGDGGKGGGIFSNAGPLSITNSTVSGNTTGSGGRGGYYSYCPSPPEYCYIDYSRNGKGGAGGGIYAAGSSTLSSSEILNNVTGSGDSGGPGGGIWAGDNLVITDSTISGNTTGNGGESQYDFNDGPGGDGGGVFSLGTLTMTDSVVASNSTGTGGTDGDGGGIASDGGSVTITGSTVSGNVAEGTGGGIWSINSHPDSLQINASTVSGNVGGGVYSYRYLSVIDSTITDNHGTGIFAGGEFSYMTVSNSSVSGNDGAGISSGTYGYVSISDSVISGNSGTGIADVRSSGEYGGLINVRRSTVSANAGGGISGGVITVEQSEITGNTNGGGIRARDALVRVVDSVVSNNSKNGSGGGVSLAAFDAFAWNTLEITNSTVSGNSATEDGGGIHTYLLATDSPRPTVATTTIINSTISGNSAGGRGGGIADISNVQAYQSYGTSGTTILDSTITGNSAGKEGGGVASIGSGDYAQPALSVLNSTVSSNSGTSGGGIFAAGDLTIDNSLISENTTRSSGNGGGILTTGTAVVTDSTVSENTTGDGGSGRWGADCNDMYCHYFYYSGGSAGRGAGIYNAGSLTISGSSITDNHTGDGGFGDLAGDGGSGGGILSRGLLSVENSTVSGNTTGVGGPAAPDTWCEYDPPYSDNLECFPPTYGPDGNDGDGGGIWASGATTISSTTITNNGGGGVVSAGDPPASIRVANTIVSGNGSSDVEFVGGTNGFISDGYNLIGDGNAVGNFNNNDQTAVTDPRLEPLGDNGGPTLTHALLPDSPALNAGDPGFIPPPEFDQRGDPFARVVGGRIDIGSFESQDAPTVGAQFLVVDIAADASFRYDEQLNPDSSASLASGNNAPQGTAVAPDGSQYFVVDLDRNVYVYDATTDTLVTSWAFTGLASPTGITTDGVDVWIVSKQTDRVYRFAGGASFDGGTHPSTSSFRLNAMNAYPQGITTDGTSFWVVNDFTNRWKTFKYDISGNLIGSWNLDADNKNARGVTLDPSNPNDLLVVHDGAKDLVFRYEDGANRTSGSLSASEIAPLASANQSAQGIAAFGGGIVSLAFSQVDTTASPIAFFNETTGRKRTEVDHVRVIDQVLGSNDLAQSRPRNDLIYLAPVEAAPVITHNESNAAAAEQTESDRLDLVFEIWE